MIKSLIEELTDAWVLTLAMWNSLNCILVVFNALFSSLMLSKTWIWKELIRVVSLRDAFKNKTSWDWAQPKLGLGKIVAKYITCQKFGSFYLWYFICAAMMAEAGASFQNYFLSPPILIAIVALELEATGWVKKGNPRRFEAPFCFDFHVVM